MEGLGQDWCPACQHALQPRQNLQARRVARIPALAGFSVMGLKGTQNRWESRQYCACPPTFLALCRTYKNAGWHGHGYLLGASQGNEEFPKTAATPCMSVSAARQCTRSDMRLCTCPRISAHMWIVCSSVVRKAAGERAVTAPNTEVCRRWCGHCTQYLH